MHIKTGCALAWVGVGAAVMMIAPARADSGTDKLMQVTAKMSMQMAGMPALPARTLEHEVCMPAGKFDPDAMQSAISKGTKGQCNVENYTAHGNDISYDMVCKVPEPVTSHAEVHLTGDGGYTGTMHTKVDAAGHAMTMNVDYTAKPTGGCTYTPPASS